MSNILFVFWAMAFQEKLLPRFTDLLRRFRLLSDITKIESEFGKLSRKCNLTKVPKLN